MFEDEIGQREIERQQPRRERQRAVGLDLAIADMGQPVAIDGDQAPARRAETRIKAEQDYPSFSSTASDTS